MPTGPTIAQTGLVTLGTAQMLFNDIDPARFARLPHGANGPVQTNHPAWVYGHLGLYGSRMLQTLGRDDEAEKAAAPEPWQELFGVGSTCRDDADGGLYPGMDQIAAQFESSFAAMLEGIKATDRASFEKINPHESMRERFPTIGVMATFLATSHAMLHLGQVSVWRRMEGLGSALGF